MIKKATPASNALWSAGTGLSKCGFRPAVTRECERELRRGRELLSGGDEAGALAIALAVIAREDGYAAADAAADAARQAARAANPVERALAAMNARVNAEQLAADLREQARIAEEERGLSEFERARRAQARNDEAVRAKYYDPNN
jgi:hypothetical protein